MGASTCGVCSAVLALLALPAQAGFVKRWSLEELARADVLAVARVESAAMSAAPARQIDDRTPVHTCTADLAVLRSFGEIAQRVRVAFECYREQTQLMSGYPVFPRPRVGDVGVFPLRRSGARWRLYANEGVGLVLPALADSGNMAGTPLGFLVDELANGFLHGTYRQTFAAAQYTGPEPTRLVQERIATDLADGDPRWLDIGSALLAVTGYPRTPLHEARWFAAKALSHVRAGRRRPGIVRNMLRHSDVHSWGSAATLAPEFQNEPLLLELLPGYLRKDHPGALTIGWWLARNGQVALLPPSLEAAVRRVAGTSAQDLSAATSLIATHGSEAHFTVLINALLAAKDRDRARYVQLWQPAHSDDGPRALRLIAVWLADERPWAPGTTMRFCDVAGGRMQAIAKQDFGFKHWDQDLGERRQAVERARAWLRDRL